ncbi:MAG: ChaN family lipoprotein [Gammaproteobacteria bacterium]|nr:ChaN family lipoprotein [Gammaproteobacteria bacterium]
MKILFFKTCLPVKLLLINIILLTGCAVNESGYSSGQLVLKDHILIDKIWDVKQQQYITVSQLYPRLIESKYLFLGETHDNISHHQHQAEIINYFSRVKADASVHYEMIDDIQYDSFRKLKIESADQLITILEKVEKGWDYSVMYRPVFEQTLQAGYKIYSANLNRTSVRHIFKEGEEKIPANIKQQMDKVSLTEKQIQSMRDDVIEGHCHNIPESMINPMILSQRVRDASMSLSLLKSKSAHRLLITGSGHARNDRGAPVYIDANNKQNDLVSIGFIEVIKDKYTPEEYIKRWGDDTLPFDYVWFTPRFDRDDPCVGFVEHIKKAKNK